jgi:hypothetical protein
MVTLSSMEKEERVSFTAAAASNITEAFPA